MNQYYFVLLLSSVGISLVSCCDGHLEKQEQSSIYFHYDYEHAQPSPNVVELLPLGGIAPERRLLSLFELLRQPSMFKYRFAGYIRLMTYADSRQVFGSEPDDYVMLLPKPVDLGLGGRDINARGEFHIIPFETRLLTYILGPDVCGLHTHARIEADYLGRVNAVNLLGEATFIIGRLRLRHAYIDFEGNNFEFRAGHAWNPLTYPLESPNTLSFSTFDPINPVLRMPQLRFTAYSANFELMLALLARRNNVDNGPVGFNSVYSSRSLIPDLQVHGRFYYDGSYFGSVIAYGRLTPRLETNCGFATTETFGAIIGTIYYKLGFGRTSWFAKCTLAQNGTHAAMVGGYAVKSIDLCTDRRKYTNLRVVGIWSELIHDRDFLEVGIVAGYLHNRGFKDPILLTRPQLDCEVISEDERTIFGFLAEAKQVWKVTPRIRFVCDHATFGFELDYTGTIWAEFAPSGKLINPQPSVHNIRGLFSVKYNFA